MILVRRNLERREITYFFPSIIAFIASIRSESESPGAKNGLSKSSTVVGVAWPQIRQSCSSPNHISFCRTIYSVQSRCLAGAAAASCASPCLFEGSLTLPVDWRLVMRRTTWRTPDLGISGIWVARSARTRTPVKKVAGVRLYLSRDQVTFSSLGRLEIRALRLLARPVQQIFRRVAMSPLLRGSGG